MKKRILFLVSIFTTFFFLTIISSCSNDDEGISLVKVSVQLELPEEFINPDLAGHNVVLSSNEIGELQATTNKEGVAIFEKVVPGVYNINTSWSLTADEYREATGVGQNSTYIVSGSIMDRAIAEEVNIKLMTSVSTKSSIVISKIYYAGSLDNNNKRYIAGQYIELFNNSSEEMDISDIYLGMVESNSTPAYALGKTPDYVYLKQVFKFPANSKVAPGKSIIITNSAMNHSENSPLEHDLTNADFEAKNGRNMINNPEVPAMEVIYTSFSTLTSINFTTGGPSSIVLFKTDEDINLWEEVFADGKTKGVKQKKMPVKFVIDGVDILKHKTTGVDVSNKRLYDYIDAGYANIEATTGKTGEVVYRKLKSTEEGRNVLFDTNNSSNDFAVSKEIAPRENK